MAKPKVIPPQLRSGPHGPGKPNAATQKIRDDRAKAQAAGVRYIRPAAPAAKAVVAKAVVAKAVAAKPKVNAQTQAIRDDRAEAKAKGQVYMRSVKPGSPEAKMRAKMGVNEVLMNRRLTIRTANRKKAAAAAKAASEKGSDSKATQVSESQSQSDNQTSNTSSTSETSAPARELSQAEKDRIARKKAEAAAGK
jgi:hypothetical protein